MCALEASEGGERGEEAAAALLHDSQNKCVCVMMDKKIGMGTDQLDLLAASSG